jgi:4'-phosphopantetheinyl transferase
MRPVNRPAADRQSLLADLENSAHVWFLETDGVTDPAVLEGCAQLLSADEADRYRRFRFDADRHVFLLSHAMLRRVLSRYADIDPSDWQFSSATHGRPEIAQPDRGMSLRFNLTHTRGLAACIVTQTLDCGVDAEALVMRRHAVGVAERMFAEAELQLLRDLEGPDWQDEFIDLWTLREAYCKACGTGLANSGRYFHFERDREGGWQIRFTGSSTAASDWHVSVERVVDSHKVAVAVNIADRSAFTLRTRQFSF